MGREEVYRRVMKVKCEEGKKGVKELEERVGGVKKGKEDGLWGGDWGLGGWVGKDLKGGEGEMKELKKWRMRVKERVEKVCSGSVGEVEKGGRDVKGEMKGGCEG